MTEPMKTTSDPSGNAAPTQVNDEGGCSVFRGLWPTSGAEPAPPFVPDEEDPYDLGEALIGRLYEVAQADRDGRKINDHLVVLDEIAELLDQMGADGLRIVIEGMHDALQTLFKRLILNRLDSLTPDATTIR